MKRLLLLLSCSGALLCAAELSNVQSVYLMPMSHGLDQYLAGRLATERLFRVVTDPALADAIFSDRFGESFQAQLEALLPPPLPPEEATTEESSKEEGSGADAAKAPAKAKHKDAKAKDGTTTLATETANKLSNPALSSTFGRAKGTVFLVDKASRQVVWSVYQVPKDNSSKQLERTASDIVSRLRRDLKGK
jgi:hypothetical protein